MEDLMQSHHSWGGSPESGNHSSLVDSLVLHGLHPIRSCTGIFLLIQRLHCRVWELSSRNTVNEGGYLVDSGELNEDLLVLQATCTRI